MPLSLPFLVLQCDLGVKAAHAQALSLSSPECRVSPESQAGWWRLWAPLLSDCPSCASVSWNEGAGCAHSMMLLWKQNRVIVLLIIAADRTQLHSAPHAAANIHHRLNFTLECAVRIPILPGGVPGLRDGGRPGALPGRPTSVADRGS